jgi:integrase
MPCRIPMRAVDREARKVSFYEVDIYGRLVDAGMRLGPPFHCFVLLAGDGGLRRNEVIALNLNDVDFVRGEITVRRSVFVRRKCVEETTPKGAKAKTVPTTRLLAALKACRHLRGARVLYTDDGRELTPKVAKLWMMRVERAAGLTETGRVHVLRHTFCTHMAQAGVPARTIQTLARHSALATTELYLHTSPEVVQLGVDMLAKSRALGGVPVVGEPIAALRK